VNNRQQKDTRNTASLNTSSLASFGGGGTKSCHYNFNW